MTRPWPASCGSPANSALSTIDTDTLTNFPPSRNSDSVYSIENCACSGSVARVRIDRPIRTPPGAFERRAEVGAEQAVARLGRVDARHIALAVVLPGELVDLSGRVPDAPDHPSHGSHETYPGSGQPPLRSSSTCRMLPLPP